MDDGAAVDRGLETSVEPGRPRRSRRLVSALVLVVAVVAGAWVLTRVAGEGRALVALDVQTDAWAPLPEGPLSARSGHVMVWTGKAVIVWGGVNLEPFADGASYRQDTGEWRAIPPAPIGGRSLAAGAWTGRELVVWGGVDASGQGFADGAAYDPERERWRPIAPSPLTPRVQATATWTGREVLVVAGTGVATGQERPTAPPVPRTIDGAAYDPKADTWRTIASSALPESSPFTPMAWTGKELVVVAGGPSVFLPRSPNTGPPRPPPSESSFVPPAMTATSGLPTPGSTPTTVGMPPPGPPRSPTGTGLPAAAYDPGTNRWRDLPRVPVDETSVPILAWTGRVVVAISPTLAGAVYNPSAGTWRPLPSPPEGVQIQSFTAYWTGREVLMLGTVGSAYDPAASRWRLLPAVEVPQQLRGGLAAAWTGELLITWGGLGKAADPGIGSAYRPPT